VAGDPSFAGQVSDDRDVHLVLIDAILRNRLGKVLENVLPERDRDLPAGSSPPRRVPAPSDC
jgi:hypothetical protein